MAEWREKGVRVEHVWRRNRTGYKAGAMADVMPAIAAYEFICIFDADFHPVSAAPAPHPRPQVAA